MYNYEILKLDIDGFGCNGHNFMIDNCEGFILKPDEFKRFTVSFKPTFQNILVETKLLIIGKYEIKEITIKATIPSNVAKQIHQFVKPR